MLKNSFSLLFFFSFFFFFFSFSVSAQTLSKDKVIAALRAADFEQTLEIEFGSDLAKIGATSGGEATLAVHQIFNLQIGEESGSVFFDAIGFSPDFERDQAGRLLRDGGGVPIPRRKGYLVRAVAKITETEDGKVILTFEYPFPLKGKRNSFALIFFIDGNGLLKADAFNKAKNQFAILTTGQKVQ